MTRKSSEDRPEVRVSQRSDVPSLYKGDGTSERSKKPGRRVTGGKEMASLVSKLINFGRQGFRQTILGKHEKWYLKHFFSRTDAIKNI